MRERLFESTFHHSVGRNQLTAYLVRDGGLVRDLARVVAAEVHEVGRLVDCRMERDVADQGAGEVLVLLCG